MAYIEGANTQEFTNYLSGATDGSEFALGGLSGLSGGLTTSGSTAAPAPEAGSTPASQTSQANQSLSYGASLGFGDSGALSERILQPLGQGLEQQNRDLSSAVASFNEAAGPDRSWDSVGGSQALSSYLTSGQGQDQVSSLFNAQYSGPQSLGFQPTNDLQALTSALGPDVGSLGLTSLATPELTPGEARAEARDLWESPDYQQQYPTLQAEVQQFYDQMAAAQKAARERAAERAAQESGIATQAKQEAASLLGQKESGIYDLVGQRNAQNERVLRDFQALQAAQSPFDVSGTLDQYGLGGFQSDIGVMQGAAQTTKNSLAQEYQDLADYDLAQIGVNSEGIERRYVDIGGTPVDIDYAALGQVGSKPHPIPAGMSGDEFTALAQQLVERQDAYEKNFAPATTMDTDNWDRQVRLDEPKMLSAYDPLYFKDSVSQTPFPDFREYLDVDEGTRATFGNTATDQDLGYVNRARALLGQMPQIASENPFEAAKIMGEVDKFLQDEEQALEDRGGALKEANAKWAEEVGNLRRAYFKAQRDDWWSWAAPVFGAVLGGPLLAGAAIGGQDMGIL